MSAQDGSAEIYEFSDARSRVRSGEMDIGAFATAGGYLKSAREALGLSLEEISARTHIKAEYLAAIEENDAAAMPSKPFALGFVKSFAEALELDADAVVGKFKVDAGFEAVADVERAQDIKPPTTARAEHERKDMSLIAVVAVFVFILWCAWQITRPRDITAPYRLDGAEVAAPAAPSESPATPAPGASAAPLPEVI
ncbi:MAG: helix-turn-helix domain-containing protein, partial [Pseudomonadota bacterium]